MPRAIYIDSHEAVEGVRQRMGYAKFRAAVLGRADRLLGLQSLVPRGRKPALHADRTREGAGVAR